MPVEKSAGAVIFRKERGNIYYLLLHYPSSAKAPKDYWDFPKGHIKKGEKELETVKREIKEETGLEDLKFVEGFKEWIKYFFKKRNSDVPIRIPRGRVPAKTRVGYSDTILKTVAFYLAETKTEEVKISSEHIGYKWLSYKEAIEQLKFKNAKEILKKANDYIIKPEI